MPDYPFLTVDVFTTERFGGNPLAVLPDARGLSTEQMARIAREFNYSESTFVLPPANPANTANVRIFTPTSEIPFAGHPNVGTSFVLAQAGQAFGKPIGDAMIFEELAGLVHVAVDRSGSAIRTSITAPEPLTVDSIGRHVDLAACLSIDPADIEEIHHPPVTAGVGLTFVVLALRNLDTLSRCKPDIAAFEAANRHLPGLPGGVAIFAYVRVSEDPAVVQARMFAPLDGVIEDPATGSASAALGALLTSLRPEADLEAQITIRQGIEMGRPSLIELNVAKIAGDVTRVRVSGSCVDVMRGTITV